MDIEPEDGQTAERGLSARVDGGCPLVQGGVLLCLPLVCMPTWTGTCWALDACCSSA